jgi:hypothetical protein
LWHSTWWCVVIIASDEFWRGVMVALDDQSARVARARIAHSEEGFNIFMALAALGAAAFLGMAPEFSPTSNVA